MSRVPDEEIPTITISHYTRGRYLGTDDPTVNWAVLYNATPLTADITNESIAREYAKRQFEKLRSPARLTEWDGDNSIETVLEEK